MIGVIQRVRHVAGFVFEIQFQNQAFLVSMWQGINAALALAMNTEACSIRHPGAAFSLSRRSAPALVPAWIEDITPQRFGGHIATA